MADSPNIPMGSFEMYAVGSIAKIGTKKVHFLNLSYAFNGMFVALNLCSRKERKKEVFAAEFLSGLQAGAAGATFLPS